jgi:hypothetical protein
MTQLRHCKCGNSNYFDRILDGIGHRGSSFSDIDAVAHDHATHRFLIQEFKGQNEPDNPAQHWMLREMRAHVPPRHFTFWHVVRRTDGQIGWAVLGESVQVISLDEYRERYRAWWDNVPYTPPVPRVIEKPVAVASRVTYDLTDKDIDAFRF